MHVYIYMYMYTYIHIFIYIHMYVHMYMYMYICLKTSLAVNQRCNTVLQCFVVFNSPLRRYVAIDMNEARWKCIVCV